MKTSWFDKKVLVLGLSKSGIAAAKYLNKHGAEVYITESRGREDKDKPAIEELKALGIKVEMGGHSDEFIKDSLPCSYKPRNSANCRDYAET